MKTRIEIAKAKIEKIQKECLILSVERENLKQAKLKDLKSVITNYFSSCLEEGDELDVSSSRVEFLRPQEGYSYKKDILTLYFKDNWQTQEIEKLSTSFYSTTENSEFELRRMILIGKVGQVVLDYSDDIIGELNQVVEKYRKQFSELDNPIWELEKTISQIKKDISKFEKEDLLQKLKGEGVEVKDEVSLPSFDYKFNYTIHKVKKIKVIDTSSSGKTSTIEITRVGVKWNPDSNEYVNGDVVERLEKVKMDKVESFLVWNREKFSAS